MHSACEKGYHKIIEFLLKKFKGPRDVNIENEEGDTPLHVACLNSRFEVVKLLTQ